MENLATDQLQALQQREHRDTRDVLRTGTSSRRRCQYQEGQEARNCCDNTKNKANRCFCTTILFKLQDWYYTGNGSHTPLQDDGDKPKYLWWNLKKSNTRRYMCHLDHHRKSPTKIIGCVIWILMSLEAAKIPNESNRNPTPNYQVRWDLYVEREEIEERTKFDHDTLNQEKHDEVTDPTSTDRVVCGHESTKRCVLTSQHVESDQTSTERPSRWIKRRNTNLVSEYQDCHMQLWKKQNISEFKSL